MAGGAQAIGALAFGLPEAGLEPVDRIVGPGNAWVTAAKIEVCGEVGIDLPAGPSEGLVLAAPPADPRRVATDLITQAEHGPDSPALLVTTDAAFADAVEAAGRQHCWPAPTGATSWPARSASTAGSSWRRRSTPPSPSSTTTAPSTCRSTSSRSKPTVARVRNAGSVFVGPWAPESAGDYATGANHVLPTGGLARASGGLAVESYGKFLQVQRITREGLAGIADTVTSLAEAEGLLAHRDAVLERFRTDRP